MMVAEPARFPAHLFTPSCRWAAESQLAATQRRSTPQNLLTLEPLFPAVTAALPVTKDTGHVGYVILIPKGFTLPITEVVLVWERTVAPKFRRTNE